MAKVIKFPFKSSGRFDLKPVRKKRTSKLEQHGQLNIFEKDKKARIVSINKNSGSFEAALNSHDINATEASCSSSVSPQKPTIKSLANARSGTIDRPRSISSMYCETEYCLRIRFRTASEPL